MTEIQQQLNRIEQLLTALVQRETIKEYYSTEEFARMVDSAEYTIREHCRLGRIRAEKRQSGHGRSKEWAISHQELLRSRKEGLLPYPKQAS